MIRGSQMQNQARVHNRRRASSRGFSTIELVIVVAIGLTMAGMVIPVIQSSVRYFALRSAVSSLTGAIQSTRYQAIFHGCKYQIAFTQATYSYQISAELPLPAAPTVCSGAYANVGTAVPLAGANNQVSLNADVTLVFSPGGTVTATKGTLGGIQLTQANRTVPETIQVSTYGKILVTP
jgi:Tfp pilus assembly protein FimT